MLSTKNHVLSVAFAAFLSYPAVAQSPVVDTDGDGMYSLAELQAVMPEMTEDGFARLDLSGDGLLDKQEIAAATTEGLLHANAG